MLQEFSTNKCDTEVEKHVGQDSRQQYRRSKQLLNHHQS